LWVCSQVVACVTAEVVMSSKLVVVGIGALLLSAILAHAGTDTAAKCRAAKATAAGKKAAALLRALGKNVAKNPDTKLTANISKAESKFTKTFTKAEAKDDCPTTGDSEIIEFKINALVTDVVAAFRSCDEAVLLYSPEGNRLRRYDLDTIDNPPLVEDILIERASMDPNGRDINGQVCPLPDGSGRFIAGEDTGQPTPPAGWGVFDPDGTQVGKLTATYLAAVPDPFGCAFDPQGRLFTTELGDPGIGTSNGQLIMWFPPYDEFPGPPGAYPGTNEPSTNFCKIATDIGTASSVAVDEQGRVYVASPGSFRVLRYLPPFPTSLDPGGGCEASDGLGSPMAESVTMEIFVFDPVNVTTPAGITRARNGNWFIASVLTGVIGEYYPNGTFVRRVLSPPPGETGLPLSTGHPQGLAVDCEGNLHYADMDLSENGGIGPGPDGKVRRISFDAAGNPQPPVIIKDGLDFPDGLGILPGDLEGP
jgi:hypothetical protein